MSVFRTIFKLEFVGFARTRTLLVLMLVSLAWMFAAPHLFCTDGTIEGAREMAVRFSLGGVLVFLAVVLLAMGAGSIARERAERRLQLTLVRPVRPVVLALAKTAALATLGALVLAVAAIVEWTRQDAARTCYHVCRPILPSPAEEARAMYAAFMADPETPEAVKRARKSTVMRLLTQRAVDHYQTVNTNDVVRWRVAPGALTADSRLAVRLRFTNAYDVRDDVRGLVQTGPFAAVVSNITQAVVTIPLVATQDVDAVSVASTDLVFANGGARALMLRPRKDVELLVAADGFALNLLRAWLEGVALLTLLSAFGVFLGTCLSRPVAVFVAVVMLALSAMSPSVVEQYPDELETDRMDAIGLSLARFSAAVTHPVGSVAPFTDLAADVRIEPRDVARILFTHAIFLPFILAFLAALILPRKQDGAKGV